MALIQSNHESQDNFVLRGLSQNIIISSPRFFRNLLEQTLTGWLISSEIENRDADINITIKNDKYVFNTALLRQVPEHSDLIDALNELFLCICYNITSRLNKARLVHCAGFVENNIQTLIFGRKKAGKSSLVLKKARHGATILADDLLIWLPNKTEFLCLGLPIRMRRPLIGWQEQSQSKSEFIAGKRTAYAQKDVFRIKSIGVSFVPEKIFVIENRSLIPVPFVKWPKIISHHTISDKYLIQDTTTTNQAPSASE